MKAAVDMKAVPAEAKGAALLYVPHAGPQTEFHERTEDFVLFGGSKFPGKTHALLFEATRQVEFPSYRAILLRRTFPRLQEIMDRAEEFYPKLGAKWEGDDKRWRFPSGATIGFGHCEHDQSRFQYQGREFCFIGYDQLEEFTETQVRYINAQCRTKDARIRCYIRATANPGGVGHWWVRRMFIDKKKPFDRYDQEFGEFEGRKLVWSTCYIPATVKDNPTGLKNNPQYLANLSSLPEAEKASFLFGDWDAYSTGCIFDSAGMKDQQASVKEASWVGQLVDGARGPEFYLDEKGPFSVWKQPQDGSRYFVSADVAKGVDGGDYSVAIVIDRSNWEVVAKWHGRVEPLEFAKILYGIGLYYNTAKVAVEAWPGPGSGTAAKLVELGYPTAKLWRRLVWDGAQHKPSLDVGWVTDQRGRFDLINALQEAVRGRRVIVRDQSILDEMFNFVRNEKGRFEARSGLHDDQVVALGIACFCMAHDPVAEATGVTEDEPSVQIVSMVGLPRQRETRVGPKWRSRALS